MYWTELIICTVIGSALLLHSTNRNKKITYITACIIGICGAPFGFSACVYDATATDSPWKVLILIFMFTALVVTALFCGRKLFSRNFYSLIFLFGCFYYILISAGLFGHHYVTTQNQYFEAANLDIFENTQFNFIQPLLKKPYKYWCHIKAGLPYFFTLPKYEQLTAIYMIQFFIGKIIEVAAIGAVADCFINMINPNTKPDNES